MGPTRCRSRMMIRRRRRGGGGEGVYLELYMRGVVDSESYTRTCAIPNEVGPARCRATPALNQSADETQEGGEEEEFTWEEEEFT